MSESRNVLYYPLRSTMKRDEFCTYVYFLNVTLLSRLVSLLANETLTLEREIDKVFGGKPVTNKNLLQKLL